MVLCYRAKIAQRASSSLGRSFLARGCAYAGPVFDWAWRTNEQQIGTVADHPKNGVEPRQAQPGGLSYMRDAD